MLIELHENLDNLSQLTELVVVWAPPPEDFELITSTAKPVTPPPHNDTHPGAFAVTKVVGENSIDAIDQLAIVKQLNIIPPKFTSSIVIDLEDDVATSKLYSPHSAGAFLVSRNLPIAE
jgi:hypothetical protein